MTLADSAAGTAAGQAGRTQTRTGSRADVSGPHSGTRGACPNFVGRAAELGRLGDAFDVVAGGRALAVLIGGDAGIGKSRIVEEFCDRVRLRGTVVAMGVCVPADSGLPYAPVLGVLREVGRQLSRPSGAAELLRELGADPEADRSAPVESGGPHSVLAPSARAFAKTVFFESVLQQLVELAEKSPVLLVFEDLQWVDSASSQLFDFLIRNLGDARVLTLGTYRSEELGQDHPLTSWLAELGRHARVKQLFVGPLDRAELSMLVADHLGERPSPALLESVWTRSLGNPFFAEELLAGGDTSRLPIALQGVINNRVKQLPEQAQKLLGVVAAAGAVVAHRLLEQISGLDADALEVSVGEAIDKKILVVDDSGAGYRFRHAMLREVVYGALLPAVRSRLHRTIAGAVAANPALGPSAPSHRIAELASHWWASGDWAAVLEPSVHAAEAAIAMLAFPEAMTFLERALLADERAPEAAATAGVTRALLLEKAADVAYLAGSSARAVELARAALEAVDAVAEPIAAARCLTLLGRNMWGVGDSAAAFDAYRQAIELLPPGAPSAERARLLAEQARGHLLMSHFGAGQERAREGISAARAAGSREAEGHALNTLGCCKGGLGFYDEAIPLIQESLAIAEELVSPDDTDRAYANLSAMFLDAGRLDGATSIMFDSAAVGEDLWGIRLNGATGNGVEALVRLGRYGEADQVLAQLGTQTLGVCAPSAWTLPGRMMIRRGRFEVAEQLIATAREMTFRLEDVQQAAMVLGLAGELDLERDRPQDAASHLEQALTLAERSEDETLLPELCMWAARAVADQCETARAHGRSLDVQPMRRRADEIVATVHGVVVARMERGATPSPRNLAAAAQAAAERSRLDGSDPQLWDEAARLWEAARERYPEAYCRWREAEAVLESRAGRTRAVESLDRAWQISRELEARPLAGRIVRLAQRGRLELRERGTAELSPESRATARLGLTAREVEVLGQLAAGRSDREIGEALFISKKTVSVHVSNVLRKLGVARRVEAGKIGQAHGLGVFGEH